MKTVLFAALAAAGVVAAAPAYQITNRIKIGGGIRWDDVYVDSANHRLYAAHGDQTEVVDTLTEKAVGSIPDTAGVHEIVVAADLGKGFTSNGTGNSVTVFDVGTLKVLATVATGPSPDSIAYDESTHRVLTFNDQSRDATIIDAKTNQVVTLSVPLDGRPSGSQADGKGHVYANVQGAGGQEIVEVSAKDGVVSKRYAIAPCTGASGLAIDTARLRLYTVCGNKLMVVSDPATGKVLATPAIGQGPDAVAFDDGYAFSPNGTDGTITMVGETAPGTFEAVATIQGVPRARTIGVDRLTHKLFVPAGEYGAGPSTGRGRAPALPDSYQIVVFSR